MRPSKHRRALVASAAVLALIGSPSLPADADTPPDSCPGGICTLIAKKKGSDGNEDKSRKTSDNTSHRSSGGGRSGPSLLQIARKQERAVDNALLKWTSARRAYDRCLARRKAAACVGPTSGYGGLKLSGVQVVLQGTPRPAGAPPAPTITPAQAGAIAVARLRLPVATPGIGPDPDKNEWKMAAIGYPLWLWADGRTHLGPVGQNVGGLTVSLEADLSKTEFRMGDGHSVTCRGGGKPYAAWVQPGAKSPTCGYTYEKPSLPSKKYTVTAIAYWDVTWRINGFSGVIQVPRVGTADLPVGELQAIVVR